MKFSEVGWCEYTGGCEICFSWFLVVFRNVLFVIASGELGLLGIGLLIVAIADIDLVITFDVDPTAGVVTVFFSDIPSCPVFLFVGIAVLAFTALPLFLFLFPSL